MSVRYTCALLFTSRSLSVGLACHSSLPSHPDLGHCPRVTPRTPGAAHDSTCVAQSQRGSHPRISLQILCCRLLPPSTPPRAHSSSRLSHAYTHPGRDTRYPSRQASPRPCLSPSCSSHTCLFLRLCTARHTHPVVQTSRFELRPVPLYPALSFPVTRWPSCLLRFTARSVRRPCDHSRPILASCSILRTSSHRPVIALPRTSPLPPSTGPAVPRDNHWRCLNLYSILTSNDQPAHTSPAQSTTVPTFPRASPRNDVPTILSPGLQFQTSHSNQACIFCLCPVLLLLFSSPSRIKRIFTSDGAGSTADFL